MAVLPGIMADISSYETLSFAHRGASSDHKALGEFASVVASHIWLRASRNIVRIFSRKELEKYDGSNGLAYVAYGGKVYDVSQSFHWKRGIHQVVHQAGYDLTEALNEAPHGSDMLDKFPIVGEFVDRE